jgi:branched-chain amino acid transport system substrate-binding protein
MNRRAFLAAAAASVGSSVAFGQPKEKVKIVSCLPRAGDAKAESDGIVNAIKLALADFKQAMPFEVAYFDLDDSNARTGSWDNAAEADIAQKVGADKDVMGLIGPFNSGAARVSAPILNKAGLVQITPAATYPGLTKKGPFSDPDEPEKYRPSKVVTFCRVCPHDASQGPLAADFAAEELKAKSVYILDDKNLYGRGLATGFKKRCEELKVKVLGHESIDATLRDFTKLLKAVKEKEPELVYFGGTTQSGAPQIAKDMNAEKVTCPLLLPEGCYELAFISAVGEATLDAMRCFITIPAINTNTLKGRGAEFVKRFKEEYGKVPTAYAVYGYEAAAVLLEAIRAAGKKDREAVRKAVVGTKDFDKGLLGKWSFDADGDTTLQPLTVATVEKGKFKSVKVLGVK